MPRPCHINRMNFLERYCPRAVAEQRPAYMGIVNVTPDSFSDGGTHDAPDAAADWAAHLLADGADILDLGAESTRPGFDPHAVTPAAEAARLLPALRAIRARFPHAVLSIDTRHAAVAAAALEAGAGIINDVSSFEDPDMARVVRESGAGVVLMSGWREHIGVEKRAAAPGALGAWVAANLRRFRDDALRAGIAPEALCLDPGFGFGLKHTDNAEVLRSVGAFVREFAPVPILIGPSRKHFLLAQYPEAQGDADDATARFCRDAVAQGAQLCRVHAVRTVKAVLSAGRDGTPARP